MNKKLITMIFFFTSLLIARPGCYEMKNPQAYFDYKQKHYVQCFCNCSDTLGTACIQCGHYHDAHPITIVPSNTPSKKDLPYGHRIGGDYKKALSFLIKKYENWLHPYISDRN